MVTQVRDKPRIVFMGTPEFAVASLEAMINNGFNVVAVITAPDKPAGRGMKMMSSAVKQFASEHGVPVLQPEKLKNPEFLQELRSLNADLQVVVAFRMLPEVVWNMPSMGTINVHASLLPKYRGAAPINWAIINGDNETGVTTFKLTHEIDTGNILLQKKVAIDPWENAGDLHDKLKTAGAEVLIQSIEGLMNDSITPKPQPAAEGVTHAPKIFTETCRINWNDPAGKIHNLVRGLSPFPAAFTHLQGKILKIFNTEVQAENMNAEPGTVETDGKSYLRFAAMDGFVSIKELQMEGKKRMEVQDFLRGFRL